MLLLHPGTFDSKGSAGLRGAPFCPGAVKTAMWNHLNLRGVKMLLVIGCNYNLSSFKCHSSGTITIKVIELIAFDDCSQFWMSVLSCLDLEVLSPLAVLRER